MDWILDNENHLNGTRVATVRVRPVRSAYIVPDDDPSIALRAIDSCCLTWGGTINPLIPYSKTNGFSPLWLKILHKFDPDDLVDCTGISEADTQRFKDNRQQVLRWDKPLESFFMAGTLQYSALNAFAKGLKNDQSQLVIQPKLNSDSDPFYLPLIAKYGRLDERFLNETLKFHRWRPQVKYADFVNIEGGDFSTNAEGIFLETTPIGVLKGRSGSFQARKLVSLTKLGLYEQSPPYYVGGSSPEEPQDEEAFANTVIITGKEDCVSDLCLYWDLRIERLSAGFFPLWIPLKLLGTDDGLKIVKLALSWTDERIRTGFSNKPCLYIVSTSVNEKILEGKLKGKLDNTKFQTRDLDHFMSGKWDFYHSKEDREVSFSMGNVRIPIPRCETLRQFFAPYDRVTCEVSFRGIRLPQSISLNKRIWGSVSRSNNRGFESPYFISSWPDMTEIGIPDSWYVLESVFKDAGYNCEPSDKSKFALGLLRLVGSIEDLRIIASRRVYEILKGMCRIKGQRGNYREFFAERLEFDYSLLKPKLGKETDVILDVLIKKGIIFRGIHLKCPKCQLSRWYELDKVNRIWRCDGCLNDQTIPLELNNTSWKYRINELYARGHDQGAITPLLAIYALHPPGILRDTSILGYYPGVIITAISDDIVQQTGIKQMELDLVSIRDGRLIIGECKDSGEKLTKKDILRYVKLANHLRCSRIIFATPTSFPQGDQFFPKAQQKCSALIEWWQKQDILDISMRERISGNDSTDKKTPEEKAGKYLEELAYHLQQK
jgi:hypothetical protein